MPGISGRTKPPSLPANDLKASQAAWFPQGGALPVRYGTGRFDQPPVSNQAAQGVAASQNAMRSTVVVHTRIKEECAVAPGEAFSVHQSEDDTKKGVPKSGTRYMTFSGYLPFTWRWKQLLQSGSSPPSAQQMVHLFQMFPEP